MGARARARSRSTCAPSCSPPRSAWACSPANEYLFLVIASPAGAYFPGGVKPVSVWLSEDYVRAAPGGTGDAKTGGNYAASLRRPGPGRRAGLRPGRLARRGRAPLGRGDGRHEPVLRVRADDAASSPRSSPAPSCPASPVTPCSPSPRDLGYEVAEEGRISVDEWQRGNEDGTLTEVFACGTAAVITPVGSVKSHRARTGPSATASPGEVTMRLRAALLDIQTGRAPDTHGWMHPLGG